MLTPRRSVLARSCALGAAAALTLTAFVAAPAAAATDDFRVQPYLQNPTTEAMLVTWFSWEEEPG